MIGCIIMASGLSVRYGKNKLLEKLGDREVILHTAGNLIAAGFAPLTVTRSVEVKALMEKEGLACALHDGPKRSDTMHVGLQNLDPDLSGYLFMPGDQPLVRPDSLRRMTAVFSDHPERAEEATATPLRGSANGSHVRDPGPGRLPPLRGGAKQTAKSTANSFKNPHRHPQT